MARIFKLLRLLFILNRFYMKINAYTGQRPSLNQIIYEGLLPRKYEDAEVIAQGTDINSLKEVLLSLIDSTGELKILVDDGMEMGYPSLNITPENIDYSVKRISGILEDIPDQEGWAIVKVYWSETIIVPVLSDLNRWANYHDSINQGIADYYSNKSNGEYTGD